MARRAKSASPKRQSRKSGSRKKINKWVKTVLAQSKKLGLSYKEALSDPRVKAAYKKSK
jgi:hypothetical protein